MPFEILAAERLRLMVFDNRLIIDCFANIVNILIWQFSKNDRFKNEKYESTRSLGALRAPTSSMRRFGPPLALRASFWSLGPPPPP